MNVLICAPGERYTLAHRASIGASRTECGLPVVAGWEGLPAGLMTPICPDCRAVIFPQLPAQKPAAPSPGPSESLATPEDVSVPHEDAPRVSASAGGSFAATIWRLLGSLMTGRS